MKRFEKILKWTGIVLGALVAILLITNAVLVRITDSRLEQQLAAIRDAGDPLSIAEVLDAKPIPPEQNAAVYLDRARDGIRAIRKELDALHDSKTYERRPSHRGRVEEDPVGVRSLSERYSAARTSRRM